MSQARAIVDKFNELKNYITEGGRIMIQIFPGSQMVKDANDKLQEAIKEIGTLIDEESGYISDFEELQWRLASLKTAVSGIIQTLEELKRKFGDLDVRLSPQLDDVINNYFAQADKTIDDMLSELRRLQQQAEAPPAQTQLPELPAEEVARVAVSTKKAALLLRNVVDTVYDIISRYELPPNVDFQKLSDEEKNEYVRRRSVELYELFWKNYDPRRGEILRNLQILGKFLKKEFKPEEAPQFLKEAYDRIQEVIQKVEPYIQKHNLIASATDISSAFDVLDGVTPEKIEAVGEALKVLEELANDIRGYWATIAERRGTLTGDILRRLAGISGGVSPADILSLLRQPGGIFLLPSAKERAEGWINAKIKQSKIAKKEEEKREERKFRVLADKKLRQQILQQPKPWVMERTFLLQMVRDALENLYNFLGAIPPLLANEQVEYPIETVDPTKFPAGIQNEIKEWVNAGKQLYNSLGNCVKVFKRSPRQPTNADIEAIKKNNISSHLQAFIEATKKLDEAYKKLPQDEQKNVRNPADLLLHPSGLERLQLLINSLSAGSPTTETFAKSLLLHLLQGVRERQQPPIEVKHTL